MYYNEEHKKKIIERGDGYTYIGSYHRNEETIDGKNKNKNKIKKREYAKKNNIDLLEIWYYDMDSIEEILIEKLYIENN